jgi:hypothetical protein
MCQIFLWTMCRIIQGDVHLCIYCCTHAYSISSARLLSCLTLGRSEIIAISTLGKINPPAGEKKSVRTCRHTHMTRECDSSSKPCQHPADLIGSLLRWLPRPPGTRLIKPTLLMSEIRDARIPLHFRITKKTNGALRLPNLYTQPGLSH